LGCDSHGSLRCIASHRKTALSLCSIGAAARAAPPAAASASAGPAAKEAKTAGSPKKDAKKKE
jgi:hypothetical protein